MEKEMEALQKQLAEKPEDDSEASIPSTSSSPSGKSKKGKK